MSEDWRFAGVDTRYLTHGLHPYPARMIPQIARKLIERYSEQKDTILDPFCGSGSVLVESMLLGRNSIGIDINPLALIIAKAKTTPLEPSELERLWLGFQGAIEEDVCGLRFNRFEVEIPKIPNLEHWFKPQIARELAVIKQHLDALKREKAYFFFATCFSLTVRKVSNLKPGEFKIVRMPTEKLKKHNPNVLQTFIEHVEERIPKMVKFYRAFDKNVFCEVLLGDTRKLPLKRGVDLVVTSPPYGDSRTTVAYGQFSKYPALWLGSSGVTGVDKASLGGRPTDSEELPSETLKQTLEEIKKKSKERYNDVLWFFSDLFRCLEQLRRVLSGCCCFVVGNRTVKRVQVPTDQIIVELGEALGFKFEMLIRREIPSKRLPWQNAPENVPGEKGKTIARESMVVLRSK